MIELIMIAAAVVLTARVAGLERRSPWIWGALTFVLCVGSLFQPYLPLLRVIIATVVAIAFMTILNATQKA